MRSLTTLFILMLFLYSITPPSLAFSQCIGILGHYHLKIDGELNFISLSDFPIEPIKNVDQKSDNYTTHYTAETEFDISSNERIKIIINLYFNSNELENAHYTVESIQKNEEITYEATVNNSSEYLTTSSSQLENKYDEFNLYIRTYCPKNLN